MGPKDVNVNVYYFKSRGRFIALSLDGLSQHNRGQWPVVIGGRLAKKEFRVDFLETPHNQFETIFRFTDPGSYLLDVCHFRRCFLCFDRFGRADHCFWTVIHSMSDAHPSYHVDHHTAVSLTSPVLIVSPHCHTRRLAQLAVARASCARVHLCRAASPRAVSLMARRPLSRSLQYLWVCL